MLVSFCRKLSRGQRCYTLFLHIRSSLLILQRESWEVLEEEQQSILQRRAQRRSKTQETAQNASRRCGQARPKLLPPLKSHRSCLLESYFQKQWEAVACKSHGQTIDKILYFHFWCPSGPQVKLWIFVSHVCKSAMSAVYLSQSLRSDIVAILHHPYLLHTNWAACRQSHDSVGE